jgi:ATP-dependent DNA ligase
MSEAGTFFAAAAQYKKRVSQSFIPLTPEQIDARLAGSAFYVSRKYDGLLTLVVWDGKEAAGFHSSGRPAGPAPCFVEAGEALKAANLDAAVIAAELYVEESGGRSRAFDAVKALADPAARDKLALAAFDVLSLNGQPFQASSWKDTLDELERLFGQGRRVRPVQAARAANREEVKQLFAAWVERDGAEGLVARSELPLVFKIKPRHSIDAVVVGFSVGAPVAITGQAGGAGTDEVRSLLLALIDENGGYQVIGRAGNGIPAEERRPLRERLMPARVASSYVETDSNHVAFFMVRPELVVQVSAGDVIFEDSSGPIANQRLECGEGGWRRTGSVPGFSLTAPVFERLREDKRADAEDTRLGQIAERFYNPHAERDTGGGALPASEPLRREVFKKESGGKLMVLKFLLWKTNKEEHGWPAYAAACVNYSSERAEPLKQDMRVSSDKAQIEELYDAFVAANVKKGWEKVAS